ncbi:unnamed protein product [Diatraea saccharalis]|uniref:FP protein C-terminal domain-containing protein n=1 Tax=Diatraea saccharalis TaxID=40085 RepID=A0A9N9QWK7_9NEOP|nr:unnamed protein product [Diatraea saccharalis]
MASKGTVCAGCFNIVDSRRHLKCSTCDSVYDLICLNVTKKRFNSFYGVSSDKKREWTCPKCSNKRPKGYNLNTPIRMDKETSDQMNNESLATNNVTQRSKSRSTNQINMSEGVDLINTIRNEIRTTIRDELAPIKKQLGDLRDSVEYMSKQYDDLIKTNDAIINDYQNLKTECQQIRSTASAMAVQLDTIEQYLRKNNLEIQVLLVPIRLCMCLSFSSPSNKALHAAARAKAKELSYKFVWVRDGRIFMRKSETSDFTHVRNGEVLEKLK